MTLVKTLVGLHAGQVHARSDGPGLGSEFVVRLPAAAAPAPPTAGPSASQELQSYAPSKRILIVEDNSVSREMLRLLLKMNGFEVTTAEDGESGLSAIEKYHPEIAVLDIGLPKIDGYEVARRIRKSSLGRDIYLIALTGYGRPEDRQAVIEAGFNAHLVKPPRHEDLLRIVSTAPKR